MNILITGAKGILGSALIKAIQPKHKVSAFDIEDFDITDYEKSLDIIKSSKPDIVIHCAAYTNVDGCESNKDTALKINSGGTKNIALICKELDIPMVYFSTDYVFDGEKGSSYFESDTPNPLSIYGKSKFAGEEHVKQTLNKYFIVRTAWLFGKGGKNFVNTIINLAEEKDELSVVNDQTGSPTYAEDLAYAVSQLIETDHYGIYHITNEGECSWYEFAKAILEEAGLKNTKVLPVPTTKFPRPAKRPKYSVLSKDLYKSKFKPLRTYKEALSAYLK
ncbi:MAG: dTDP-4-dehydrorhamnose reductase [Armatimonadota bacterium]